MAVRKKNDGWASIARSLSLTGYLGFLMVGSIFGGLFIGWCLDMLFGTKPVFTIIFILLGVGGGFLNVYRAIMKTVD